MLATVVTRTHDLSLP